MDNSTPKTVGESLVSVAGSLAMIARALTFATAIWAHSRGVPEEEILSALNDASERDS